MFKDNAPAEVKTQLGLPIDQANGLERWIRDLYSRWEVDAALYEQKVRFSVVGRASGTYKHMTKYQLSKLNKPAVDAWRYNQKLSEDRHGRWHCG